MAGITVQTRGLAELRRDLRKADKAFGPQVGRANQAAAELVAVEARKRAPKGPHQGGGTVAPISSTITALRRQKAASVSIGGARSPHAVVTEYGGSIPRRGSDASTVRTAQRRKHAFSRHGLSVTHVRKRAYLYPAIDAKAGEVALLYGAMLDQIMHEAFGQ